MSDVEEQYQEEQQPVVQEELQVVELATTIPLDVQEAQEKSNYSTNGLLKMLKLKTFH